MIQIKDLEFINDLNGSCFQIGRPATLFSFSRFHGS